MRVASSPLAALALLSSAAPSATALSLPPSSLPPLGAKIGAGRLRVGPLHQRRGSDDWDDVSRGRSYGRRDYVDSSYYPSYDSYDSYYNARRPLFGNSEYYDVLGSNSEDFRRSSRGDRYTRREDFRNGYGGSRIGGRIQDYTTPGQREMYQQRMNDGARYGWQQQYDVGRGNVRGGTSSDFRRGRADDRIQDYLTPGEREKRQQADNRGARYGWQQQYNVGRGNVRRGSSNDFRRGRAYDGYRDFQSPKERERRQMEDNRALGRGVYAGRSDRMNASMRRYDDRMDSRMDRFDGRYEGGYGDYIRSGAYGDYDGDYERESYRRPRRTYSRDVDEYYEPEIVAGRYDDYGYGERRGRRGGRVRNSWENLRNVFKF